jgi:diguanylate cyclase (GGDEF)-like protein
MGNGFPLLLHTCFLSLAEMAYQDPLTGLANRHKFEEYVKELLAKASRYGGKFALIMIDLDHFKNINDTIGHDAGDYLLQIVAERLKGAVRDTDLIARLGGDEFALVISELRKLDEVVSIAKKILTALLAPILIKNHEFYVTTSIGISVYPDDGKELKKLLKNADLALYRAKEMGRNRYEFCTPEMMSRAHEKMIKHQALASAFSQEEFSIYYLPTLDLSQKKIVGVEALLRWNNNDYKSISTDEIISLSEETGLILPLGDWILNTACEQVKLWHDAGYSPLTLAINISPRQLMQPDFITSIMNIFQEKNFPPTCVELEITEKMVLKDPDNTLNILQALKAQGVQISIDDFGTGYSSLEYLKNCNINKIKIDRTLIQRIERDETSCAVISAIIAMAKKLNIKIVAEGVETKAQYDFLVREGCTEVQGYIVNTPLSSSDMKKFLHSIAKNKLEIKLGD